MTLKIKYVNYGIANVFDTHIEIHKNLKKPEYKQLLKHIIEHENNHDKGRYTLNDLKLDYFTKAPQTIMKQYLHFIFTTPSSWIHFSPVYPTPHGVYTDASKMIWWVLILVTIWGFLIW